MTSQDIIQQLKKIGITDHHLLSAILENGSVKDLPKGSYIIKEGQYIREVSILLTGEVRVWKNAEDGKEISLYYVTPVQTCVLSLSASFKDRISIIDAQSTKDSTALCIPVWGLQDWMLFTDWRQFVMTSFIDAYQEALFLNTELAFSKLDERVITFFNDYSRRNETHIIPLSHLQLANELGISREVISRILKSMEHQQKIKLSPKKIELLKKVNAM